MKERAIRFIPTPTCCVFTENKKQSDFGHQRDPNTFFVTYSSSPNLTTFFSDLGSFNLVNVESLADHLRKGKTSFF